MFFGKTGAGGAALPLERHLADAAAVAERLFDVALTPVQQQWLAEALGVDVATAREVVAFLAYAHDIGKLSPQFQYGVLSRDPLPSLPGITTPRRTRHDKIGQVVLTDYLQAHGVSHRVTKALAATIGGHHSVPTPLEKDDRHEADCHRAWAPPRTAMLDAGRPNVDLASLCDPGEVVVLALAGLVSVADWIASDAGRFPVTIGERLDSRELAASAIPVAAWAPRPAPVDASFAGLFDRAPWAAQRAMVDVLDDVELPALVILEDRTGSGKTESALWAALRGLQQGARGLYVALPTRATADQAHARVSKFVARMWDDAVDVRLLHGGVHADPRDPRPSDVGEDDDALGAAREWFAGARRGLLAPYGVGTVDQVLLAVLRERFYPVRFWGASGKVVVIDEVHSYDAYTDVLLNVLVTWLAALRCTVVLLSATLPSARRAALSKAYRSGLGLASDDTTPPGIGYPRLTVASRDVDRTLAIDDDRPGRRVRLEALPTAEDVGAVADRALAEVVDGGCLAVVCNTVDAAQQRFRALAERAPEVPLVLLHARIRPLEREPVERRLVQELGPDGARPDRLIVVSTQIIEQSLDLDFDAMLTDLAPIDLLIQRAGRVHRHAGRTRPERHATPRLMILDTPGDELPRGTRTVYANAVLVRTRVVLRDRDWIEEPADLDELVESVYGEEPPVQATEQERVRILELDQEDRREAAKRGGWAKEGSIGAFGGDEPVWADTRGPIGDAEQPGASPRGSAVTRWSERLSLSVVVLTPPEAARRLEPVELVRRAVAISDPRIVQALLADLSTVYRPPEWRHHGALRHHVRIVAGELAIEWDPVLGVCLP